MDDKAPHAAWVVSCGGSLLMILVLYLLFVSSWYWTCRAQIDPATLRPVACKAPVPTAPTRSPEAIPPGSGNVEEQLWPAFGSNSETYEGLRSFWGDDIVSNLFANVLGAIGKVSTPFLQDEVVPRWNEAMEPEVNRQALFGALAVILGVVAKEWAKDAYLLLRRSSRPRSDG